MTHVPPGRVASMVQSCSVVQKRMPRQTGQYGTVQYSVLQSGSVVQSRSVVQYSSVVEKHVPRQTGQPETRTQPH